MAASAPPPPPPPSKRLPPPPRRDGDAALTRYRIGPPVPVVRPGHNVFVPHAAGGAIEDEGGTSASAPGRGMGFRNAEVFTRINQLSWLGKHLSSSLVTFTARRPRTPAVAVRVPPGSDSRCCDDAVLEFDVEQRRADEASLGTGMMVWDLAIVMCDVLQSIATAAAEDEEEEGGDGDLPPMIPAGKSFSDLRVLEVGAGTAAPGLMAAALGAQRVVLTDLPEVLPLMRSNVARFNQAVRSSSNDSVPASGADVVEESPSSFHQHVIVEPLPWGKESTRRFLSRESSPFDLVIVCECIVPRIFPMEPLVDTLAELFFFLGERSANDGADRSPPSSLAGPIALVAYEHRYFHEYDPLVRFTGLLKERGLQLRPLRPRVWNRVKQHRPIPEDMSVLEVTAAPPS
jgi:hypothetical protein